MPAFLSTNNATKPGGLFEAKYVASNPRHFDAQNRPASCDCETARRSNCARANTFHSRGSPSRPNVPARRHSEGLP
jgi:hypothetical protein